MTTMIIVEDESFERKALKDCIDWELIGVQVIGEAANGMQGFNMAMELRPDIILTDVSMPVMNAIEMTEQIRQFQPETKILFISSYDDFEYARQGINLNVFAYLTKPVNEMQLLRSVKKAVDQITEKELERKLYDKIKDNYEVNLKLGRQALISRMLMNIKVEQEQANQVNLGWLYEGEGNLGEIIAIFDEARTEHIDRNIDLLIKECRNNCRKVVSICMIKGRLITVFRTGKERIKETMERLEETVRRFLEGQECKAVRVEAIFDETGDMNAGELYDRIRQKGLPLPNALQEQGTDRKKGKQQIVAEIEHIIQTQYASCLTIDSIAKAMHFTPNYIGMVFKAINGIGINRYLMNVRMENAQRLLKESDLPIGDIALRCGYENVTYFYSSFKKETGITPSEYRMQEQGT